MKRDPLGVFPDPDRIDEEVSFERAYRAIHTTLKSVFKESTGPLHITDILRRAEEIIRATPEDADVISRALQGKTVLEALKGMICDNEIKKTDLETFCSFDRVPRYRSLDDSFAPYIYKPPSQEPKIPSKKDIIASAAYALYPFDGAFQMKDLAKQWMQLNSEETHKLLPKIFGIEKGVNIWMHIIQCLIDRGLIYARVDGLFQRSMPKYEPQQRTLDDDWLY
jgi:hypothetical protein